MNLRRQLLLVSLLLITLPWAGCQYVREMEKALQSGQEQALLATARAVATVAGDKPELIYPDLQRWQNPGLAEQQLFASAAHGPIIVDGYADGWEGPVHGEFGTLSYRARTRGPLLYLLLTVSDEQVIYHDPRQSRRPTGDHLVLRTGKHGRYLISTAAPGPVQGRFERRGHSMGWEPRIRGQWQDSLEGFTIELEIPLSMLGERLGLYLVDDDGADQRIVGNITPGQSHVPWLIYPPQALQTLMSPFAVGGLQLELVDVHQWRIAQSGLLFNQAQAQVPDQQQANWLLRAIYRAVLKGQPLPESPEGPRPGQYAGPQYDLARAGQPSTAWYSQPELPSQKLLSAVAPVYSGGDVSGLIIARQNSQQYLSLTDLAFNRLLYYSLTAMGLAGVGLLAYASLLSWRIRKLSRASALVFRSDGSLADDFPVSQSADEIGELSRQYGALLDRLREYTDYLRGLSRKLSHELRTPIAVIQSSLDNLEQEPAQSDIYLQRAREGLSRLGNILTAMSEATRLEESVHRNNPEQFDLADLLRQLFAVYESVYADHRLQLDCAPGEQLMLGVPDLIAQMMDKLVDNAASFAPAGGTITLRLDATGAVEVENQGPLLPEAMQKQLFDSMVSLREKSDRVHLGLGLHIVRLIADFHSAQVQARNLQDGSGVVFRIAF